MQREPFASDRDAGRQRNAERQPVGEHTKGVQPDVGHDPLPAPSTTAEIVLLPPALQFRVWTPRERSESLVWRHFPGWAALSSRGSVSDWG